ncbi:MAG: ABC transporter permease [Pseudomonadales bacterium]
MNLYELSYLDLSLALIPVVIVAIIFARWLGDSRQVAYAAVRMLVQLLLVGYALQYIFAQDAKPLSLLVICVMIVVSTAIALRPVEALQTKHWQAALLGIALGGSFNLLMVMVVVLHSEHWYKPALLIPLAGMVYANSMNAVSLAAERFAKEQGRGLPFLESRNEAYGAALLPQVNSLLAVGLVSLPGMMTGQILSGVSPLIAVRYQIMVMCMVLGSAGISAAIYLWWMGRRQFSG